MIKYSFIITLIAALSTLIGYLFIYIKNDKSIVPKCLSFGAGVMISISLFDLIPTSISYFSYTINNFLIFIISFIIGIFISYNLNKNIKQEGLYKTGIISMITMIAHNIPEGIATYIISKTNIKLGILFAIAIIFHNIPEGISIAIPIYHSTKSKIKALIYTFIAGISEFFGAVITYLFLDKYINNIILGILFSIISSLMIYISYYELIKSSLNYNKKITIIYTIIGIIFTIIVLIILKI